MSEQQNDKKIWFVTGASKGLGLELTKKLLQQNYRVADTSRKSAALVKSVGEKSNDFLPLETDLLDEQSVHDAIQQTLTALGKVDSGNVLIKNLAKKPLPRSEVSVIVVRPYQE